jgi:hypothetical protein
MISMDPTLPQRLALCRPDAATLYLGKIHFADSEEAIAKEEEERAVFYPRLITEKNMFRRQGCQLLRKNMSALCPINPKNFDR